MEIRLKDGICPKCGRELLQLRDTVEESGKYVVAVCPNCVEGDEE